MQGIGFNENLNDSNLYLFAEIEDLLIVGSNNKILNKQREFIKMFDIKDFGLMHFCLGIEVWQMNDGVFISQSMTMNYLRNLIQWIARGM